jgi:hypothetical protein
MKSEQRPFDEGDRVEHRLFGFGSVTGQPSASSAGSPEGGVRDSGWRVSVLWDDKSRGPSEVIHHVLRKVSSPDSRPTSFYDRQWQPLRQNWLSARMEVQRICAEFRPPPEPAALTRAQAVEQAAFEAMQAFWTAESNGEHP